MLFSLNLKITQMFLRFLRSKVEKAYIKRRPGQPGWEAPMDRSCLFVYIDHQPLKYCKYRELVRDQLGKPMSPTNHRQAVQTKVCWPPRAGCSSYELDFDDATRNNKNHQGLSNFIYIARFYQGLSIWTYQRAAVPTSSVQTKPNRAVTVKLEYVTDHFS